jgi:nicotinamidase-related amidase
MMRSSVGLSKRRQVMQLNPAELQILFGHMQAPLVKQSLTEDPERIERAAGVLMKAAATFGIPATFAIVPRDDASVPIDALTPFATEANTFIKKTANPFLGEDFKAKIIGQGRRTLIVCGITSDGVVLHSALDALELGLRVLIPLDAIGCRSPRAEQAALAQIARAGGEQTSTTAILTMLAPDFSEAPGTTMMSLISELEQ